MYQDIKLLGCCGLYCGACNHFRSNFPEGRHLLAEGIKQGRDPDTFTCRGCRGEIEYIYPGCDVCSIKLCAEKRGHIHCGLCHSFPCKMIIEFQHDKRHKHHLDVADNLKELKEKGHKQWLKEQRSKWKCNCGMPFSWYEKNCNSCGSSLVSYGTNLIENKDK
ncbi:MAG: DUF3795 domain-containing protein [Actinobacteria bacterium]|nr:DUF3795 domain-containing protein [Actinomycetota bacterium]